MTTQLDVLEATQSGAEALAEHLNESETETRSMVWAHIVVAGILKAGYTITPPRKTQLNAKGVTD